MSRNWLAALTIALAAGSAHAASAPAPFEPPFRESPPRLAEPDAPLAVPGGPPPDLAFGAYQRGFFLIALREATKRVAENGKDAAAMTLLGELYRDGYAMKQDFGEAARWFRLASGLGDAGAQFEYGILLLDGAPGVTRDRAAATAQFEKAAAQGYASALYNLGVLALEVEPPATPDFAKAAGYFKRAAELGEGNAAYSYAVQLKGGKGVALDMAESAKWFKRAADAGIIAGQVEYAIMLFNGVGVERDEAGAAKIFALAAARRNPIAMNRLAHLLVSGRGVPKDLVQAAVWIKLAKAAGDEDPALDKAIAGLSGDQNREVDNRIRRLLEF
jgi:hypothetical protein